MKHIVIALFMVCLSWGYEAGTGVVVNKEYVVTANHVVEKNEYTCLYDNDAHKCYPLDVVASDSSLDVAILRIKNGTIPSKYGSCSFAKHTAKIGEPVITVGYWDPFRRESYATKKYSSHVKRLYSFERDYRFYQISVELQPGCSGGPTFDSDGNVIGISRSVYNLEDNTSNIVRSDRINAMLRKYNIKNTRTAEEYDDCTVMLLNSPFIF